MIAGSAGGVPLKVPGAVARPTTDRVRESVFGILGGRVEEASVLDLFAGSGALGIEALSRGARSAVFVERDRRAAAIIEENLAKTRLAERARVVVADVFAFLRRAAHADGNQGFDLVLADPPYRRGRGARDLAKALLGDASLPVLVPEGGVFVLESPSDAAHGSGRSWTVSDQRLYGTTGVWWFARTSEAAPGGEPGRRESPRPADL